MKTLAKLEELAMLLFSIYLFSRLPYAWWVFPVFFFAPDISLIGQLAGKRPGAWIYNLVHHKALALGAYVLGSLLGIPLAALIGALLLGHASFDRALGLGLLEANPQGQPTLGTSGQRA
jgi:hypothetical protein